MILYACSPILKLAGIILRFGHLGVLSGEPTTLFQFALLNSSGFGTEGERTLDRNGIDTLKIVPVAGIADLFA